MSLTWMGERMQPEHAVVNRVVLQTLPTYFLEEVQQLTDLPNVKYNECLLY